MLSYFNRFFLSHHHRPNRESTSKENKWSMKKEIKRILFWIGLWIAIATLLLLLMDFLIMPFFAKKWSSKVIVEDYISRPIKEVILDIKNKDLNYIIDTAAIFSSDIPENHLARQIPKAGSYVKKGRYIWLTKSLGRKTIKMPNLLGISLQEAKIKLENLDLKIRDTIYYDKPDVPRGIVYHSIPVTSQTIHKGTKIVLYVSKNARKIIKPTNNYLIGFSLQEAKEWIEENNFHLVKIDSVSNNSLLPGTIVRQVPRRIQPLDKNVSISLIVTK